MRRIFVLALAALALLGVVTSDACAQAPTPTFKINGLIDQVVSYSRNTSNYDGNLNVNDKQASDRVAEALRRHFPPDRVRHTGPAPASEDFGCFGSEWNAPSVYWFVGGTDPDIYAKAKAAGRINDLPVNHSPLFAPVIHPTLQTGIEAMVASALAWLAK